MIRSLRILLASALFAPLAAQAHPPGEHEPDDHTRTWTNAATGEVFRGSFLAAHDLDHTPTISIQLDAGGISTIPLADLAPPDRAQAQARIDAIAEINHRLAVAAAAQPAAQPGPKAPAHAPARPPQAAPFDRFAPFVKTRWDDRWLYVESDGLPHAPWSYPLMVGITSWQQQVPLPQNYTGDNAWRIPLKPELADKPISGKTQLYRGAIALAANGVPIFNALNNRGDDAFKAGELDQFGGHCGRGDDYHYHIAPLAIQNIVGKDKPIAYALDGFPILGLFDPAAKPGDDKACPLGGSEHLDEFNGHFAASTKGPGPDGVSTVAVPGLYHYHASLEYPYINGGVRGKVTVKDDQIDPQPRATPVRQWLQPLRGATITGFRTLADNAWSLEYTLAAQKHLMNFRVEGKGDNAKYIFDFVRPDGTKTSETYTVRPQRGERPNRDADRPPRDQSRPDQNRRNDRPPRDANHPDPNRPRGERPQPVAPTAAPTTKPVPGFDLSSPDVVNGRLATDCTCDGNSRSPALSWPAPPRGTKSLALLMDHIPPDGEPHVYMVIANLPAATRNLTSNDTTLGTWGPNTVNRRNQYAPPCSKGPGDKLYTITLFALSAEPKLPGPPTRDTLLAAIKDTTLATARLDVTYARPGAANPPRRPEGDR